MGKDLWKMMRVLAVSVGLCLASPSYANWTLNIAYHNPMNADLGLNVLYWASQWNFEIGVGWIKGHAKATDDANENNKTDDGLGVALAGDLNLKYRFTTGAVAPYAQVGVGISTAAAVGDETDAHANLGRPFIGAGLLIGKASFYGYVAYNVGQYDDGQLQAGLGFDI